MSGGDPSNDSTQSFESHLLKFSRLTVELWNAVLPILKEDSRQCIKNLLNYHAPHTRAQFPQSQSAAVLVPLFIGRAGDLYVVLSRRSESLRQYAGDTALPGGKVEPQDLTVEDTARREAFEEVGLAQDRERIPLLCVMESFLAGNQMIVTPVVVLILDKTMQPNLNESEVTSIFSQPLASFLVSSFPFPPDRISVDPSQSYHTATDWPWNESGTIRLHRFLTGREADGVKPVFGLTASILIRVAIVGYGRSPDFDYEPPNAPTLAQRIAHALLSPTNPLRLACEREGIDANEVAACILHPLKKPNSEPHAVERDDTSEDGKRPIVGSETEVKTDEGAMPSPCTMEEPIQCVGVSGLKGVEDTMQKNMQGPCLEPREGAKSGVSGDLCQRKEQGNLRTNESGLSMRADKIRDVANKCDSKL